MNKSDAGACPRCGHDEETVSHFLGQCPATAQLRGKFFRDCYITDYDIMDNYHITFIFNYTNYTRRLIEQENLDHSGVAYSIDGPLFLICSLFWYPSISSSCPYS